MLAKDVKIKTLKKQEKFIEKMLTKEVNEDDGDSSYSYVGYVFPEVIKYFENEGYVVSKVEQSDMMNALYKGKPVYLFTISDNITLTEEEQREAEAYEPKGDDYPFDEGVPDLLAALLCGRGGLR